MNKDILKKVRKLELKIRRMVDTTFAGEYHSAFKGQGLEFDEVRPYQIGDDIRSIDWNVTAKTGELFIKIFREEREQTLFVLFDISGSENFGNEVDNKLLIGIEIASILAFSALKNNDKIGLATFTDKIERYFKPQKGRKHILSMIRYLLMHKGGNEKTQIREALKYIQNTIKRRSIIILISDFLDDHYERTLINLNRFHEVILIRLYHPNELFQASSGTIPVIEIESGHRKWLNAGDIGYRKQLQANFAELDEKLLSLCKRNGIGYITINTQEDYIPALAQFFKKRNRNRKS